MRSEHLQYLLKIEKHGSISAAAEELYLAPMTLRAIVKKVEEELGYKVFQRTTEGMRPTSVGWEALPLIWEIASRLEEMNLLHEQISTNEPVVIFLSPTINDGIALPLHRLYAQKESNVNLEFRAVNGETVGMYIIKNEGNVGLTYYSRSDKDEFLSVASKYQINVEPLMEDRLVLLCRKDHPLASCESIRLKSLENIDYAVLSHFDSCENSVAYVGKLGSQNRYTVYPNITQIRQAILLQNMVTLTAGYTYRHGSLADDRIVLVPVEESHLLYLCLIHPAESNISYQEKVLIQCIREYFKTISNC